MALTKAKIVILDTEEEIPVQFNPSEYSININNNYRRKDKKKKEGTGTVQSTGKQTKTLSMELYFDTYSHSNAITKLSDFDPVTFKQKDVREYTDKIVKLMDVDKKTNAPPKCKFVWGSLTFTGVVESADQTFTMFMSDGKPVRARISLRFTSAEEAAKKSSSMETPSVSGTPDVVKDFGGDMEKLKALSAALSVLNPRMLL